MSLRNRRIAVVVLTTVVVGVAAGLSRPVINATAATETLQEQASLKWFRGNLHTHSHWSDGDDYLEMIALWYREHHYDFLVFTDHNTLANRDNWVEVAKTRGGQQAYGKLREKFPQGWIDERTVDGKTQVRLKRFAEVYDRLNEPDQFLLIQGEEISDKFEKLPIHLNASNVREAIPPMGGDSVREAIQKNVDALIAQRERTHQAMMIHLNHPNFGWGVTAEDLAAVRGENFFEVYNGHPSVENDGDETHASTERLWDIINARRLTEFDLPLLYGLANDDGHNYHHIPSRASEPGRGWVMVLAERLTPESLIHAMEAGKFYASSGVTLSVVRHTASELSVEVRPEPDVTYTIDFIGTRKGFDPASEPVRDNAGKPLPVTRRYSPDIGAVLKSVPAPQATYRFAGDELYVRARITSSRLHPNPSKPGEFERAWTQPVRP